jgi:hypothetical protein
MWAEWREALEGTQRSLEVTEAAAVEAAVKAAKVLRQVQAELDAAHADLERATREAAVMRTELEWNRQQLADKNVTDAELAKLQEAAITTSRAKRQCEVRGLRYWAGKFSSG